MTASVVGWPVVGLVGDAAPETPKPAPHAFRESVGTRPWLCGECGERESHRTHPTTHQTDHNPQTSQE